MPGGVRKSMTIKLELPDTPAMRKVLRLLATHAAEDNAEALRVELEEPFGDVDTEALQAEVEANEMFDEIVTRVLMPEGV